MAKALVHPIPRPPPTSRFPLNLVLLSGFIAYHTVRLPLVTLLYSLFPGSRPNPQLSLPQAVVYSTIYYQFNFFLGVIGSYINRRGRNTFDLSKSLPTDAGRAIWIPAADKRLLVGQVGEWIQHGNIDLPRVPAYWAGEDRNLDDVRARSGEITILNFHGGGFIDHSAHWTNPISNFFWLVVKHASQSSSDNGKKLLTRGLNVEYRLSNETSWPGIVADAVAAYSYLVDTCKFAPENIILMGDSAGGNLILALVRHLHETKVFPVPGGMIPISPWTDLSMSTFDTTPSAKANASFDYIRNPAIRVARDQVVRGMPFDSLESPYLSPGLCATRGLKDVFDGYPPALFIAGGKERWFSEISDTYEAYIRPSSASDEVGKKRSDRSEFYVEKEMPHDFIAFADLGCRKECDQAAQKICSWISSIGKR
ncbi:hypothetical protein OC846_003857 [Tilletia horrida]|uniref:Alpha/beta hydrolase fold-3 domain-containing protein n=1 Tax=Tilletia horrida TaxID=155126 RepID=A0AAN6JQX8_9BASI|nr:hypothetical protein OC845_004578 [Tilletia horrida]KAK0549941.1 hypothetical protein OC846_003857 [Tilletia horrida]KAK0565055.1 hypothetical protein OC861_003980 [Tilletia horrida]